MHKGRLEAFSDGVLAIIITIMVLELKVPHGTSLADRIVYRVDAKQVVVLTIRHSRCDWDASEIVQGV